MIEYNEVHWPNIKALPNYLMAILDAPAFPFLGTQLDLLYI